MGEVGEQVSWDGGMGVMWVGWDGKGLRNGGRTETGWATERGRRQKDREGEERGGRRSGEEREGCTKKAIRVSTMWRSSAT